MKKLTPQQESELKWFIEDIIGYPEPEANFIPHIVRVFAIYGYDKALQSARWLIEDAVEDAESFVENEELLNLLHDLSWHELQPYVEEVIGKLIKDHVIKRTEERMDYYVVKEIQKLFQELENRELFISSPQEFADILKNKLLEKNIFDKVKKDLLNEGLDWPITEDELADLFQEAIDYNLDRKAIKELISKSVQEFLAHQTAQNLWRISL